MFAIAGPAVAPGRELALGLVAGGILYFAPTLVALARHRGAAPLTFSCNLLLGWTGVGWVLAWFLALADRRLHIYLTSPGTMPAVVPTEPPPSITLAPDGRHWWDGYAWHDGWQEAPRGALQSPDGTQWFTGTQWVATTAAPLTRPSGLVVRRTPNPARVMAVPVQGAGPSDAVRVIDRDSNVS